MAKDPREILFEESVQTLMTVVDKLRRCLAKVSDSLQEIVPNVTVDQEPQQDPVRKLTLLSPVTEEDESEEKGRYKTKSNKNAAVIRTQNFHRMLHDRPPTPIAKFSSAVSSSSSTDEWIRTPPVMNQVAESETNHQFGEIATKEKEWLFPSPVLKRWSKKQADDENLKFLKEPASQLLTCSQSLLESCIYFQDQSVVGSQISRSTSSDIQSFNLLHSSDGNWKGRYIMNRYDPADSAVPTMMYIKETVMNPTLLCYNLSRSVFESPSSVFVDDIFKGSDSGENQFIPYQDKKRNAFIIKNAVTQTEHCSESSLPAIEEDPISRADEKRNVVPFGAKASSWCTLSENGKSHNSEINKPQQKSTYNLARAQKYHGHGRLGILGSSSCFSRLPPSSCRKHRVCCIFCGRKFTSKHVATMKESRRSMIKVGAVRQLVDKWESQYIERRK